MNAKELIEYCKGRITYYESFVEAYTGIINPLRYEEKTKAYKDIITALSATIPRETAKCKPTEAEWVLFRYDDIWKSAQYKGISGDRARLEYRYHVYYISLELFIWLPMPAAPEVEP